MSKISRKCLSLVLVLMLLASLSVNGALNASADNKTGDGLAAYAMTAYNEGWSYVWGGASYGAVDCSGLIYSYVGGGARVTEDMLYSSPESGYVSDGVPDIPGLGLWQPGHVGVYVGGGMAVDARDEISNVCYQSVSTKSWVMWFKVAGVTYGTDTGVTKNDQSDKTADDSVKNTVSSDNTKSHDEKADETLSLGSTGSDVNKLQERLKTLGYFNDDTTEYFGYVTKGALEDFQSEAGLDVTGVYDSATKKALEAANAPSKPKEELTAKPDSDEPETVIRFDTEESDEVSDVDAGSDAGEDTDEIAENDTQSDEPDVQATDEDAKSVPEEDDADEEETLADSDADENDEQSSANGSEDLDADEVNADVVYELGDEAAEISDIQYILIKLGYFDYDITGTFCENTADAVESFRCDFLLGDERYLDQTAIDAIYGVYNGTYFIEQTVAKAPLYESIAADDETGDSDAEPIDPQTEQTPEEDSGVSNEQSVTITLDGTDSEKDETTAENAAAQTDEDKPAAAKPEENKATAADSSAKSPKTGEVVFIQTGIEDHLSAAYGLILLGISLVVIFFAGTIHYWNVSMEKRRQRARRATTVSVYRRSSM